MSSLYKCAFGNIITSTTSVLDVVVCYFCQETTVLQEHNFKRKWIQNENPFHSSLFFFSEFSFADTDNSQYTSGREGTIFMPLYDFHPLKNVQTDICTEADL